MFNNISRSKGNQAMKFGQLKDLKPSFLKDHTENVVEKLFPGLFLKTEK